MHKIQQFMLDQFDVISIKRMRYILSHFSQYEIRISDIIVYVRNGRKDGTNYREFIFILFLTVSVHTYILYRLQTFLL